MAYLDKIKVNNTNVDVHDSRIPNEPVTSVNGGTGDVTLTIPAATTTSPKMNGTAAVGSEAKWAKGDHVHPSDTSKLNVSDTITETQINTLFMSEITFYINGVTYHAREGMTWGEWVNSEYNTAGASIDGSLVIISNNAVSDTAEVLTTDIIVSGRYYGLSPY